MTDTRTLATRLIALRIVKDWIGQADAATRTELLALAVQGDRLTAAVETPEGVVPVGSVTATKGRSSSLTASVVDADALLRWCREHRPSAVSECVRASDQKVILEEVKAHGGVLDKQTGMVTEVPGVIVCEPEPGAPGLMVKPSPDAERVIRAAVESGLLSLAELTPALPEPS